MIDGFYLIVIIVLMPDRLVRACVENDYSGRCDGMKIGLPRALLFYYYYPLWKKLFELLDVEVVLSDPSNKHLVEKGIKVTVPEICIPIKIFNGHVIDLLERDVDMIFVPRFISVEKDYWFCPKFLGLPELVTYNVPGSRSRMLTFDIETLSEDTSDFATYKPLCTLLGVKPVKLKTALKEASGYWQRFRRICRAGYTIEEAERLCREGVDAPEPFDPGKFKITLGVLGYVYNIYNPFASLDIVGKLRSMGVNVITFEMMDEKKIRSHRAASDKNLYWTFSDKLAGAAGNLLEREDIDGLIHVTAFGCGPDSIIGKLMELESEAGHKPLMTLRIDEHTGESHLQTRLEAFVDMIVRKKQQGGRVTA